MEKLVLDEHDLSARWGVNVKTLKRWRNEGRGPRYIKIGRSVTYLSKDIEHFETHALYIRGSSAGAVELLPLGTTTTPSPMEQWQHGGRLAVEREIRPLLRDYVEMLLYTGVRHGTEAMGIRWRDLEWHTKDGVRYLRVWVDGKTGGRWLIAKHKAVDVLRRLHARQKDISEMSFETTLTTRVPHLLFRFSDGHQPHSLVGTFRKLMRDSGLLLDAEGQTRTLYSLRHTYATLALLEGGAGIHTLSKQMGNSAAMIERHYSKLTATMAADRLA